VLEVGIGGRFDATNLCEPRVTGITSLSLEHTDLLGHTLAEIAYHKGGIIKPGVPLFTVPQPPEAAAVLAQLARAAGAPMRVVPPLDAYPPAPEGPALPRLPGAHQHANASLALQLSREWLRSEGRLPENTNAADAANDANDANDAADAADVTATAQAFAATGADRRALAAMRWPGRSQAVDRGRITFLLDGAHTAESCEVCAEWAASRWAGHPDTDDVVRVLWFNLSGARDPGVLLQPFAALAAQHRITAGLFSPNVSASKDNHNAMVASEAQRSLSAQCREVWRALQPPGAETVLADSITGPSPRGGFSQV
jgi:folylpolyglutamate synthase